MIVGGILALFSSLALVPHIQDLTSGFRYSFVPDSYFWTLISLIVLGGIAVQFVAWIGAVLNTNQLVDKTWFNVLLWCGIAAIVLSLLTGLGALVGWGLMIVYLVGGPDGMAVAPMLLRATPTEPPKTLAPTG